jgi:pimeloyl-ACP methyl ester carboxylesterase
MKIALIIAAVACVGLVALGLWLWTPDRPRAELEAKYLASPDDMMEIAGTRLHVRDSGPKDAPAVVLLHGFGASLHTFEPWAEALAADHRVIRFDLPGAGLSEPDPTGLYTDARSMEILVALLDRLGIDQASLIGHSIGGRLGWSFAAAHPDRVARLVLIAPDGFASPGFEYGRAPETSLLVNSMRYVLPKPLLRSSLAPAYGDPKALTETTVDRYYDLMLAPGVRSAMIARMEQTIRHDPRPLLRTIGAPVLLVWGTDDGMIPAANAQDYLRELPDARLVSFPGLGHVPHEEAPAVTLVPVKDFLDGREPQPAS